MDLPVGTVLAMGKVPGCGSRKGEGKILSPVKGHQAAFSADCFLAMAHINFPKIPFRIGERVCILGYPGLRTVLQEVSILNLRQ